MNHKNSPLSKCKSILGALKDTLSESVVNIPTYIDTPEERKEIVQGMGRTVKGVVGNTGEVLDSESKYEKIENRLQEDIEETFVTKQTLVETSDGNMVTSGAVDKINRAFQLDSFVSGTYLGECPNCHFTININKQGKTICSICKHEIIKE